MAVFWRMIGVCESWNGDKNRIIIEIPIKIGGYPENK
jgi:hypothetical protein